MQFKFVNKATQIHTLNSFQSIALQAVSSDLWYVSNYTLRKDFKVESVKQLATKLWK